MTDRRLLLILITGCLVFGSITFVELEPTGTEDSAVAEAAARPDAPPAARRQQNQRLDELLTTILARPLFSSSRSPPQSVAAGASADSDLTDTRLAGIVTEPGRRIAIFAVSGDKPLKVAEGDAVNGWRIESITPREVSLSGPTGTKTLQPKLDPNLAAPPSQPPATKPVGRLPAPPGGARPGTPAAAAGVPQPGLAVPINNPRALPRPVRPRQQR
jgi:hypothetical protein